MKPAPDVRPDERAPAMASGGPCEIEELASLIAALFSLDTRESRELAAALYAPWVLGSAA